MEVTLKQPREDVAAGVDRDDDLLSFDESAVAHRDALIGMARLLHSATLVGDPAPVVVKLYERITKPCPGDLVVELSAMYSHDPVKRIKALGILIEKRQEWYDTDEEWADLVAEGAVYADEDRRTDTAWYIQYGSAAGDVCRWTDCDFMALLYDWVPGGTTP